MVGLLNEFLDKFKDDNLYYQVVNLSGKAVYIYNHLGIVVFSPEQMVFKVKERKTLLINGIDLSIIEMDSSSAVIGGTINSIEVV